MEEIEERYKSILIPIFDFSSHSSSKEVPKVLSDAMNEFKECKSMASVNEKKAHLNTILDQHYPSINKLKGDWKQEYYLQDKDENDITNLVLFLLSLIKDWGEDSEYSALSIFSVIGFIDCNGFIWKLLREKGIAVPVIFLEKGASILLGSKIEFSVPENAPNHEKEWLDRLKLSITERDWEVFTNLWKMLPNHGIRAFEQLQVIYLLINYDRSMLVDSLNKVSDIPSLMTIMNGMGNGAALLVGKESDNELVKFTALYCSMSKKGGLSYDEENLISEILLSIEHEPETLKKWLKVFNQYPDRYPKLQKALGKFLSESSLNSSIEIYINAIGMESAGSREQVAICLEAFSSNSDLEKRKFLWNLAFLRWNEWGFGDDDQFEIVRSNLDYAIIGYLKECKDSAYTGLELEKIVHSMHSIMNEWYVSSTRLTTRWNCLLSKYQLFAHALIENIELSSKWLIPEIKLYEPRDFNENEYIEMIVGL